VHRILLVLAFAVTALAQPVAAQLTRLPNTGCTPLTSPSITGGVALGQTLNIQWQCSSRSEVPFTIIGLELPTPLPVPNAIDCTGNSCVLGCSLLIVQPVGALSLMVPNDSALVGQCFCFQCGCWNTVANCMTLTVAVRACIQ
jgi:hypothetical protein